MTRWNCIRNHTVCDMLFPISDNWFNLDRDRENNHTFYQFSQNTPSPYFLPASAFSFTFDGSDLGATCLSQSLIGLIISLLMCEAVSSSHSPTIALFQTEWRQIIPCWHRCVSVIIIRSYTDHRPLPSPPLPQIISWFLFAQTACTVRWFEKHILSSPESSVIRFLIFPFQVA